MIWQAMQVCWWLTAWFTYWFRHVGERYSNSLYWSLICLHCWLNCCIVQWHAWIGKQVMLSVNNMLVLLTELFYQSPIALNRSLNHAISHRYACIANQISVPFTNMPQSVSESCYQSLIACIAHWIMLSVTITLVFSLNRYIVHWHASVSKWIMLSPIC